MIGISIENTTYFTFIIKYLVFVYHIFPKVVNMEWGKLSENQIGSGSRLSFINLETSLD